MIHDSFDYFAAHSYLDLYDHVQRRAIDYLIGGPNPNPTDEFYNLSAIKDPAAKVEMLALAQLSVKNYATSGDPRERTRGLRGALPGLNRSFEQRMDNELTPLGLTPALPALDELPELSFALHFRFRLRQPYLSHDEAVHYLLDNPVRKEKVFRLPYVAPTQWKGTLHAVMVQQLANWWERKLDIPLSELQMLSDRQHRTVWWKQNLKAALSEADLREFIRERAKLLYLFGTEKDFTNESQTGRLYLDKLLPPVADNWQAAKYARRKLQPDLVGRWQARKYRRFISRYLANGGFLAGRLQFYASFFTQLGLEVMNPHSRKTGSGEVPILFETVPRGAEAGFTLLYVPHDKVGQQKDPQVRQQVAEDLKLIARGLREMFCLYGFGAKVTSGFGRAEEKIEGKLALRTQNLDLSDAGKTVSQPAGATPLPKYLEAPDRLKPEYLNPDDTFRERSEAELKQMGKMARWEYDKARKWWQAQAEKAKQPTPESKLEKHWPEAGFRNFDELEKAAERLADALRKGDAK